MDVGGYGNINTRVYGGLCSLSCMRISVKLIINLHYKGHYKFSGVLSVHPRNLSCVTNLGHYNSFITTLETDIINNLLTGTILEYPSEILGARAKKCFDAC